MSYRAPNESNEEILFPELPIVDPHHHLIDHGIFQYSIDDLKADAAGGHNIVGTVYLDCNEHYRTGGNPALAPVGETEFVNALADGLPPGGPRFCAAIVAHADLRLGGAVDEVLEAHRAAAPRRFRGIRHSPCWDADSSIHMAAINDDPALMANPQFQRGAARLSSHGLVFETFPYHHQLAEFARFARALPDVTIILNHIGGPLRSGSYAARLDEVRDVWRRGIAEVARLPNVLAKLGGFAMPISGFDWHLRKTPVRSEEMAASSREWYLHVIEQFGPDRCMFESNFPVDRLSCSYVTLWNCFKRMTADFSEGERRAMFHDVAARAYRLDGV